MSSPPPVRAWPRPRLVLSKCLEIEACRYNAQLIRSFAVRALEPWVEFIATCPEVEVGLGVPRDPIRLVQIQGGTHLIQPSTGKDLTEDMAAFSARFLDGLEDIDGFLLKSKSPSCGIDQIKVYAAPENAPPIDKQPGLFAAAVQERFPSTPVEHEGRLTNLRLRDHYLTRIFALAELRACVERGTMAALVDFQARQKLTLMAHAPHLQRQLGRIVANQDRLPAGEVFDAYRELFGEALARQPRSGTHVNVIQHAQGYFKDGLTAGEKKHFLDIQEEYRLGRVGRGALLAVVQSWVHRFGEEYLARQSYLAPYPRELVDLADSGGTGAL